MSQLAAFLEEHSMPEPNSGCHLWLRTTTKGGYANTLWQGKNHYAHRLAWTSANGPIPAGEVVRHKCDVRSCVNPDHLLSGTHKQNVADMIARNRQWPIHERRAFQLVFGTRGEQVKMSSLTADDVRAIRVDPRPQHAIGAAYGVGQTAIHNIKARKTWRHIA